MVKLLTKPQWIKDSGAKICEISLYKETLGKIKTKVVKQRDFNYVTNLIGEKSENLGSDYFYMNPKEHLMIDYDIRTPVKYRGKYRLGELLRLISIIQMNENNIQKMDLYSRENAVLFHARYGFKPKIRQFLHRDKLLEQILNDKRFEDLCQKAAFVKQKIVESANLNGDLRALCVLVSELVEEYIQRIMQLSKTETCTFNHGFDMELNKDFIIKNKEKFNEMLKKQGLDYKI